MKSHANVQLGANATDNSAARPSTKKVNFFVEKQEVRKTSTHESIPIEKLIVSMLQLLEKDGSHFSEEMQSL